MKYAFSLSARPRRVALFAGAVASLLSASAFAQQAPYFSPGNLVVAVSGCGVFAGSCVSVPNGTGNGNGNSSVGGYGDNQAAPLTLFQFAPAGTSSATFVNSLVLPQAVTGANFPVSAEYGSSSEDTFQLSGNGQYLTIMGYGIDVASFNANPGNYGSAPSFALAQSGSLTNAGYTAVPRVVALIDAFGNVNSSTALYNIFDTNNPRSIFTANGSSAYVSGQGNGSDATGGVFYTALGAPNTAPTPITGLDTTSNTLSQDTRDVQIVNNTLYVSVDTKGGKNSARSYIGTLGTAGTPPTSTVGGPVMLTGYGNTGGTGKYTITTGANGNGNGLNGGVQINLSPENYFFAHASTLYVADSGFPKNDSTVTSGSSIGDGGLQKWTNSKSDGTGTWTLAYTLHQNLPLVPNTSAAGTTGLYGLTGAVNGNNVQLFATNFVINDLDPTFLYGITDTLAFTSASQAASENFTQLAAAPSDSNFKGVAFTPTAPPPAATPANLIFSSSLTNTGNGFSDAITISNTGGTSATGVTLTSVKLGSTLGSPLPDAVGTVSAGGSTPATISFPASAGVSGAASTITISGTYNGGSFTSTARVRLP